MWVWVEMGVTVWWVGVGVAGWVGIWVSSVRSCIPAWWEAVADASAGAHTVCSRKERECCEPAYFESGIPSRGVSQVQVGLPCG